MYDDDELNTDDRKQAEDSSATAAKSNEEVENKLKDFLSENNITERTQAEKDLEEIVNSHESDNESVPLSLEETLKQELAESQERMLRAFAEVENIRKRSEKEKKDARDYAITTFARDMLSITDNMARAMASIQEQDKENAGDNIRNLIIGIEMIHKELHTIFERNGIKSISPIGEKFDPNYHQAMFESDSHEYPAGHIMQVISDGYLMKDRILRPAMVGVVKATKENNEKKTQNNEADIYEQPHKIYEDQKSDETIDVTQTTQGAQIDKNA